MLIQKFKVKRMSLYDDVNALRQQQQILMRTLERKEISEEEYNSKMEPLLQQIKDKNKIIISQLDEKRKAMDKEFEDRRIKMADEKVKEKKEKVVKDRKVRGPKTDSYASVILEVLQMKSVKNVDAAADKVLEKKPGRDKQKVKSQITVMINEVKKGKKPAYSWDAENFQLNVK